MDRPANMSEAVQEFARNVSHPNPEKCACHGGGWILSPMDTWETCRLHFNKDKHPHPEDFDYDAPKVTTPPDPAAVAANAMTLYGALVCILADLESIGHVGPVTKQQAEDALLAVQSKPASRFDIKEGEVVMVTIRGAEVPATVRVVDPLGQFRVELASKELTWVEIGLVRTLTDGERAFLEHGTERQPPFRSVEL
jgi:hypothetical protein